MEFNWCVGMVDGLPILHLTCRLQCASQPFQVLCFLLQSRTISATTSKRHAMRISVPRRIPIRLRLFGKLLPGLRIRFRSDSVPQRAGFLRIATSLTMIAHPSQRMDSDHPYKNIVWRKKARYTGPPHRTDSATPAPHIAEPTHIIRSAPPRGIYSYHNRWRIR